MRNYRVKGYKLAYSANAMLNLLEVMEQKDKDAFYKKQEQAITDEETLLNIQKFVAKASGESINLVKIRDLASFDNDEYTGEFMPLYKKLSKREKDIAMNPNYVVEFHV